MRRFRFPLDRVLRYRQLLAEAEEARLEAQLAHIAQIDARMAQLEREWDRTAESVRLNVAARLEVRPSEFTTYPDYRALLARGKRGLVEEKRKAVEETGRQRAAVVEARRAREILVRARGIAHDDWRAAYLREQESTAGELFLNKWKRRAKPPGV